MSSNASSASATADGKKDDDKKPSALDAGDIALLKSYGVGPYHNSIKKLETDIESEMKKIQELIGVRESETGLAPQNQWDIVADKQMMNEEHPLNVARCTKIINAGQEDAMYMINVRQYAKFVVALGDKVSPTDIDEGMRVGVEEGVLDGSHLVAFGELARRPEGERLAKRFHQVMHARMRVEGHTQI